LSQITNHDITIDDKYHILVEYILTHTTYFFGYFNFFRSLKIKDQISTYISQNQQIKSLVEGVNLITQRTNISTFSAQYVLSKICHVINNLMKKKSNIIIRNIGLAISFLCVRLYTNRVSIHGFYTIMTNQI
jgi:hypothetical protein